MFAAIQMGLALFLASSTVAQLDSKQAPSSPSSLATAPATTERATADPEILAVADERQEVLSPAAQIALVASFTLVCSFFCSLFEASLYSITVAQTEMLKHEGVWGADRLARLRQKVDEPITAILTLNTIANTIGSAWAGALVGYHYEPQHVAWFAGGFTMSILLFSEILPKSLGVAYSVRIGPWMAWPLQLMIWVVWPLVKLLGAVMYRLTGKSKAIAPTEDEIIFTSRLAFMAGQLRSQELRWIENALLLDTVKAYELMTPRTVVYTLPADMTLAQLQHHSKHWNHSRLPLTEDRDPDRIVGMVYRREVFDALVHGGSAKTLRDLMHDIDFVPEQMRGHQLLDKLVKEKKHMVCVVNEYGGFEGVVTLEDVLECLLGTQIVDEHDRHADLQLLARQRAQKIHQAKLDAAKRILDAQAG